MSQSRPRELEKTVADELNSELTHEPTATRSAARRILGQVTPGGWKSIAVVAICMNVALVVAFWLDLDALDRPGRQALFILVFAALLWVTEAMPAFAVSLLVIGLEIMLLGRSSSDDADWQKYIATWGSPLIWLFFGGFVLAKAAERTRLIGVLATALMSRLGTRPAIILGGVMGTTAALSMFISNTATATMMVAVLTPVATSPALHPSVNVALLLGIAMGANIGGMGTIIGTPPNAIAAGALEGQVDVDFGTWMMYGTPPAMLLLLTAWIYLVVFYLGKEAFKSMPPLETDADPDGSPATPKLQQSIVVGVFIVTVVMWLTSPLHHIPTTVVSFIPICALTATGILASRDIRTIPWDVLLLIAGGLSLGVAIRDTGLALWLVDQLPLEGAGILTLVIGFCYLMVLLSNLMSNTAAANLLIPLMLAVLGREQAQFAVAAALSASAAMCLPISTPPNAIVYGTQRLPGGDLLRAGLLIAVVAPPVAVGWLWLVG